MASLSWCDGSSLMTQAPLAPPRTCQLAWPRSDHPPGQSLHYAISCVSITPALGAAAADDLAEEQVRRGRARGRALL